MIKINSVKHLISLCFFLISFSLLASCGSDNGSNPSPTETGSVALLLTDAPSDIFEEINISVSKAELVSDDRVVTLFKGSRTFNLLDLTDARIFTIREGIPAAHYNKIRLTLTDIELVDYKGTDDPADDDVFYPQLPANGKLDLNPRGTFEVVTGGTLAIQIDIDASKSIHIVETDSGEQYQFRPVVFISIITDSFNERYVKLHGDITQIDIYGTSFRLCNTDIPVQTQGDQNDDDRYECVKVSADTSTSIFDANGKPSTLADLVEGEPATVFGRLKRERGHDDDDDDDDDEGKEDEDEPHENANNKSNIAHEEQDDEDEDKDDRDDDDNDEQKTERLVLVAALIELGPESTFQKLNGKSASDVIVDDQFDMDVAPGQGLITPLTLNVQIQTGTIMINRKGTPVDPADINTGKQLSVRGVLNKAQDTLFASLIIIDTDNSTKLGGKVGDNPDGSCGLGLMTSIGDRSVSVRTDTRTFLVSADTSTPINISELVAGQQVDVYGSEDSGCFAAHTIIAY